MESIFGAGLDENLSLIVSLFIKVLMVLLTLLSLVTLRQASLMDKVVNVPVGGWFKGLASFYFWSCLVLTIGIIVIV